MPLVSDARTEDPGFLSTTSEYLRAFAPELMAETAKRFVPLVMPGDPLPVSLKQLKRKPLEAQEITINGLVRQLHRDSYCNLIGEMGTGKTLMGMAVAHAHAGEYAPGSSYTAIIQVPGTLTKKWAREIIKTIPQARVFFIDGVRGKTSLSTKSGVNEVVLNSKGRTVRNGNSLKLSDLRQMKRRGWARRYPVPCFFVVGKDTGKLSYGVRSAALDKKFIEAIPNPDTGILEYGMTSAGVNPDTYRPVKAVIKGEEVELDYVSLVEEKIRRSEIIVNKGATEKSKGMTRFSALWQADNTNILRMAPMEFIGRYLKGFFTYGIADEMHQLAGETAQGQSFSWLISACRFAIGMTGTMMGGYASDLFNLLFRSNPRELVKDGFTFGDNGKTEFQSIYGVVETIRRTDQREENAVHSRNKKKATTQIKKRPGCSPLVFAKFLLGNTAFVSLEDISRELPQYSEEVISIELDQPQRDAYEKLQNEFLAELKCCAKFMRPKVRGLMIERLMLYPDHSFNLHPVKYFHPPTEDFGGGWVIAGTPTNFDQNVLQAKERELLKHVQTELAQGRRCQIYVQYTNEHDVRERLRSILTERGIRVAVLHSTVKTEKREDWYADRLAEGVDVTICHPKLVETGLDLLAFPTLIFYECPTSLHTLRQGSRRSWRIGQTQWVRVLFFVAARTLQEGLVRLMGKKMLCALAMEGKFSGQGLQAEDLEGDLFSNLAKELLSQDGVKESASEVWGQIGREQAMLMAANDVIHGAERVNADVPEVSSPGSITTLTPEERPSKLLPIQLPSNVVPFPVPSSRVNPRTAAKREAMAQLQLSLFAA